MAVLLWAASQAASAEGPAVVAVLAIDADPALPAHDRDRLREHAADALRAAPNAAPLTILPDVPDECSDASCLSRTLQAHDVTHWLGTRVRGQARSYDVEVELWEVGGTVPIARMEGHCSICGQQELRDMVAAQTIQLHPHLPANETPTPLAHPPRPTIVDRRAPPAKNPRPLRVAGYASVGVAAAAFVAGSTLVALHGREHGARCRGAEAPVIDPDGDCRYVHDTVGGGVAFLVGGALATATGITLLTIDAKRNRRRATIGVRLSPRRVALVGHF